MVQKPSFLFWRIDLFLRYYRCCFFLPFENPSFLLEELTKWNHLATRKDLGWLNAAVESGFGFFLNRFLMDLKILSSVFLTTLPFTVFPSFEFFLRHHSGPHIGQKQERRGNTTCSCPGRRLYIMFSSGISSCRCRTVRPALPCLR